MPIKKLRPVSEQTCCKPLLTDRPLMTPIQAGGLSVVFKVLANDTQLRLLHAPSAGRRTPTSRTSPSQSA
jgi:hypothetical protein